ncbi:hypothetical protein J6590_007704 [Homalodisca vitripennis]|nr:hypothetical protein J6590_007704 [Homalodisca vitripennis]
MEDILKEVLVITTNEQWILRGPGLQSVFRRQLWPSVRGSPESTSCQPVGSRHNFRVDRAAVPHKLEVLEECPRPEVPGPRVQLSTSVAPRRRAVP